MELIRNNFKKALAERRLQIGLWSSLCSSIAAEIVGDSGFDWLLVDAEHSPNEVPDILAMLQALQGGSTSPVVRPAWNDPVLIKRVLDLGAQSLLIPYVQNAHEAELAVAATRYPPGGIRGVAAASRASRYGRINGYLNRADEEICVLVQIETRSALTELEAIASVEGVDGVFIGPSDLSASFNLIGQPGHPEVQAAIKDAVDRIARAGKPVGILTGNETEARRYIDWGCTFVAVGSDVGVLAHGTAALASKFTSRQR